jgi:hypothetical protein
MDQSRVFGVVDEVHDRRQVAYLERPLPVTPDVVALAGPVDPKAVFRFAAPCAGAACRHFDGHDCTLASRIVELLPMVVTAVPPCAIRPECRWWKQEGARACLRCPQIASLEHQPSAALRAAADPGSAGLLR